MNSLQKVQISLVIEPEMRISDGFMDLFIRNATVMKRNGSSYFGLWLLITVAMIIFLSISLKEGIEFGEHYVKASSMANIFKEQYTIEELVPVEIPEVEEMFEDEKQPVDSTSQNIMIIGDSMTFNLALRLAQYAKQNGHTIHAINWDSSNTKIWAETDTLDKYIDKFSPTFIFISLGSNETYFKNPETRVPYIKRILEKIGDIDYVWIGPPNWNEDTGINDWLQRTCRKGSFFRSEGIKLARKKDNIHPTRAASAIWMDSIMRWMPESAHPILADLPSDSIGKVNPNVLFLKALNK